MKPKLILGFALVLSGGLLGCSSIDQHSADSNTPPPDLYLHLIASFEYPKPPQLIVSAPIRLSCDFDIIMDDNRHLKGRIESRNNGKFFVHFQGCLYSGTNVYDGEIELEKPDEPGPQPYDGKAPFVCQPMFILSSNPSPKSFLQRQAAAEKKFWQLENPLTARQVAEVKKKFVFLRPGLTENKLFAVLGLSRYRNRLHPPIFVSYYPNNAEYQLARGQILVLAFDCTGCPGGITNRFELPGGLRMTMVDNPGFHTNCIVVQAILGTESWSEKEGMGKRFPDL